MSKVIHVVPTGDGRFHDATTGALVAVRTVDGAVYDQRPTPPYYDMRPCPYCDSTDHLHDPMKHLNQTGRGRLIK